MAPLDLQDEHKLMDYLRNLSLGPSSAPPMELIRDLDKCVLLPNQMIWVTHYYPVSYVYKRNIFKVLGYEDDTFDSLKSIQAIHPEDYDFVIGQIEESLKFHALIPDEKYRILAALEYRMVHLAGHTVKIQRISYPLKIARSGHMLTVLNISTDITFIKSSNEPKVVIYNSLSRERLYFASKNSGREYGLSKREIQILQSMANGMTSDMIGDQLCISKHTVDVHRRKMLEKTGKGNTAELITYAYRAGIIV